MERKTLWSIFGDTKGVAAVSVEAGWGWNWQAGGPEEEQRVDLWIWWQADTKLVVAREEDAEDRVRGGSPEEEEEEKKEMKLRLY